MSDLFDRPFEDEDDEIVHPPPSAVDPQPTVVRRIFSVSDLTVVVRDLLEAHLFEVWVEGELSNCKIWNTGHLYFTLKDDRSQLRGFMFRSSLRYLKFKPTDGTRVIARGKITVYEPKGEYQLVCEHLEPQGRGALQLAFEQLKSGCSAKACSTRRGSGRCLPCRGRSAWSPRSKAPRFATSSKFCNGAMRTPTSLSRLRGCRAPRRRRILPARCVRSAVRRASSS